MLNNTTDVDIMTGRKLSSFQVANIEITYWLVCSSTRKRGVFGGTVILASFKYHFIRVYDNLIIRFK